MSEPRPSRARARNTGARATEAPILAFLDADCVPGKGWPAALARAIEDGAELAGGPIEWRTNDPPSRIERFDAQWRARVREGDGFSGSGNLAVRRDTFVRLGGFDPGFTHAGEDSDLARRAGTPIRFVPDAVVSHAAEHTARGLVARAFRHGFANVQMRRRFGPEAGRAYWRHPRPLIAGDWALERFGIADPDLRGVARLDYAGRVAGSLWAELRRAR